LHCSLLTTASLLFAGVAFSPVAHAAFDPNAESNPSGQVISSTRTRTRLPDTAVLRGETMHPAQVPAMAGTSQPYVSPLQPVAMPRPLYPSRTLQPIEFSAPAPAVATASPAMPELPPVDPAVAAQAAAELQQQPTTLAAPAMAASSDGFIAPAPVFAASNPAPAEPTAIATAPAVLAAPTPTGPGPIVMPTTAAPAAVATLPQSELKADTRTILSEIPSKLDSTPPAKIQKLDVARVSPQIKEVLGKKAQEEEYNSVGLSIKVRRPGLDANYELNQAYTALMGGDSQRAIEIYKNIIGQDPKNEDALFGLAATYHRLGETDKAKPFYGMLLKSNPNHREALNNFLTLVSDESPQDALPELERLELRNPDFSPIPAQIAIVLDKLGYPDKAEDKMLHAIELAPDNLTYKYNLAIMLDRHKRYADAGALYQHIIQAGLNGEPLPAPLENLQKRLNYITADVSAQRAGS
jgi:tetratricopeptide (TPR) repeat protein